MIIKFFWFVCISILSKSRLVQLFVEYRTLHNGTTISISSVSSVFSSHLVYLSNDSPTPRAWLPIGSHPILCVIGVLLESRDYQSHEQFWRLVHNLHHIPVLHLLVLVDKRILNLGN